MGYRIWGALTMNLGNPCSLSYFKQYATAWHRRYSSHLDPDNGFFVVDNVETFKELQKNFVKHCNNLQTASMKKADNFFFWLFIASIIFMNIVYGSM